MRTLPEFLAHFASPRTPCDGERLLVHFLKTCPEAQEAPTLDILLGRYTSPRMTVPALKKALFKRITPELFEASKPEATDLSENLALLWPGGSDPFTESAWQISPRFPPRPSGRMQSLQFSINQMTEQEI